MAGRSLAMASHFEELEDPRVERTRKHSLVDILCLSICAVIAGAEGWEDIEEFGLQKEAWLRRHLRLENGIPSHDTISRVFRLLKPQAFEAAFRAWVQVLVERLGLRQIAVDGKTLRRSHDRGGMKSALHVVCAWSVENHLVLGQEAVADKSNEITAIPELLKLLELKGAIVTIDAMGCQTEIADKIIAADADYVLAVKGNQPTLHEGIAQFFLDHLEDDFAREKVSCYQTEEHGHGREETRTYYVCPVPDELPDRRRWKKLTAIGIAINDTLRDGQQTSEVRYYILSKKLSAKKFGEAVRGHWSIENRLHWQLDVTFGEDQSRIRKGHADANFSILRRTALSLLKNNRTLKVGVKNKRLAAGWNDDYLAQVLCGT